jgi:hypothetical protein
MKILNKEDSVNKLYIQKNDLIIIKEKYNTIPEQLDMVINNDEINENSFVEITDKGLIGYINLFKWIIDYKQYQNINVSEYNNLYEKYIHALSRINQEIYFKTNSSDLQEALIRKKIISKQINDIYLILQNVYTKKRLNLPVVVDFDKEGYKVTDNNETYIIKQTLDSNTIIVEKENKGIINLNDYTISMFNAIINKGRESLNTYDEYQLTMNEDNTRAIINFKQSSKEKELIKAKSI